MQRAAVAALEFIVDGVASLHAIRAVDRNLHPASL